MSRSGSAIALSSARGIGTLSSIGIAAVVARLLDKADYATYRQTLLVYTVAAPVVLLCMPSAMLYFVSLEPKRKRAILLGNFCVTGVTASLFALFCLWPGALLLPKLFSNSMLEYTVPLLGLYAVGQISLSSLEAFLVACDRAPLAAGVSASARLLSFLAVCTVAYVFPAPFPVVVAQVGVSFVAGVVAVMLMISISRGPSPAVDAKVGGAKVVGGKAQLVYALPLGLAVVVDTLSMSLDKVYVAILKPQEDYAVFVNGAMEIPLIGALSGAVGAVMLPDIARAFAKGDGLAALDLWKLSIRRLAFVIFPLCVGLYIFSTELMVALYSNSFVESAIPFRIYLLILPARAVFFANLFRAAGQSGLVIRRSIYGLLINAIITYPFIIWFGTNGAAWATVLSFWLFVIPFSVMLCRKMLGVRLGQVLPWAFLARLLALSIVAGAASALVENLSGGAPLILEILLRGASFVAVFLAGAKFFFPEDLNRFLSILKRVRRET